MRNEHTISAAYCISRHDPLEMKSGVRLRHKDGIIQALEPQRAMSESIPNHALLPAFANAHDHGRGLKTLAYGVADQAVETWVAGTYTLPPIDPYLVAANAFANMAQNGIGSVVHCHLSRDPEKLIEEAATVKKAAEDVGIRVAFVIPLRDRHRLAYADDEKVLASMPKDIAAKILNRLKPIPSINAQIDAARTIANFEQSDLFKVQLGPVGIEWCSAKLLERISELAHELQIRVHMHMLESRYQREWIDKTYPNGILQYLDQLGLLNEKLTIAHGTWLTPQECQLLAERNVTVSINTSSNLRLRSGIAPLKSLQHAKTRFAIGLDALALDDDDDILREVRLTQLLHAGVGFEPGVMGHTVMHAACCHGNYATGNDGGRLEPGQPADFIVLNLERISQDLHSPLTDIPSIINARASGQDIESLVVAGRTITHRRKVLGIDQKAVSTALHEALKPHIASLCLGRSEFEAYRQSIEKFYRQGGHLNP